MNKNRQDHQPNHEIITPDLTLEMSAASQSATLARRRNSNQTRWGLRFLTIGAFTALLIGVAIETYKLKPSTTPPAFTNATPTNTLTPIESISTPIPTPLVELRPSNPPARFPTPEIPS